MSEEVPAQLVRLALEYERRLLGVVDVLKTYDRMKAEAPSMSPESAIECIRQALGPLTKERDK